MGIFSYFFELSIKIIFARSFYPPPHFCQLNFINLKKSFFLRSVHPVAVILSRERLRSRRILVLAFDFLLRLAELLKFLFPLCLVFLTLLAILFIYTATARSFGYAQDDERVGFEVSCKASTSELFFSLHLIKKYFKWPFIEVFEEFFLHSLAFF